MFLFTPLNVLSISLGIDLLAVFVCSSDGAQGAEGAKLEAITFFIIISFFEKFFWFFLILRLSYNFETLKKLKGYTDGN